MATRWGICGTGKISNDFTAALKSQPESVLQSVAVAARHLERAQNFAKIHRIPRAYGSYNELAKDPEVDVVYIGTVHPAHHELTLLFLNHGKHVLCEKPAAMNLKQLKEMTSLAKEKKLFFMEAVWTRFFPLTKRVLEELSAGTIGRPRVLKSEFCVPASGVERIYDKSLGGGAMLDVGVYPINIACFLFGFPDSFSVEGSLLETGADEGASVVFKYKDGRIAQLLYHVSFEGENESTIYGTKGTLKIHSPCWCPTELTLPSGKVTFELPEVNENFVYCNSSGLVYEALHVRECIQQGRTESPLLPLSHSEAVMAIFDQIKPLIGLKYDVDEA